MTRPTLPTIILGRTIQKLREEAGLTQGQLAKKCRFSPGKMSMIENGKQPISLFDTAGICRILNAPDGVTRQMERMATEADTPGWWEPYSTYMMEDFSMFLELEHACSGLYIYESELVTGLLQTAAYARAINAPGPELDENAIEKSVALRETRQESFWSRDPLPEICIILNEPALTRPICGPEGDAAQRDRLIEVASFPNVDIRVLPMSAGAHPSMQGAYTIMTSSIPEISDVVYTEGITGATYEETDGAVRACRKFFEATKDQTIPIERYFNDDG